MFTTGCRAKVLMEIRRKDHRSVVYPGEEVTITNVFNCQDGETQIVGIQMDDNRLPMIDIVCFKDKSPLMWVGNQKGVK